MILILPGSPPHILIVHSAGVVLPITTTTTIMHDLHHHPHLLAAPQASTSKLQGPPIITIIC